MQRSAIYVASRLDSFRANPSSSLRLPARPLTSWSFFWVSLLVANCLAGSLQGQAVRGTVKDHQTGRGVPDATIMLLNEAGIVRNMALTDSAGSYRLDVPAPGRYSLRVDAAGFNTANVDPFLARAGRILDLDIDIWSLTELEPVVVTAEERPFAPGPLEGFYERMERGRGQFITRTEIEQKGATRFTEIFRLVPGVTVVPRGGSQHYTVRFKGIARMGGDCPPVLWVDDARWGSIDYGDGADRVLFPSEIQGIEIYTPSTVPAAYATGDSMCGVIVVWTKRAP